MLIGHGFVPASSPSFGLFPILWSIPAPGNPHGLLKGRPIVGAGYLSVPTSNYRRGGSTLRCCKHATSSACLFSSPLLSSDLLSDLLFFGPFFLPACLRSRPRSLSEYDMISVMLMPVVDPERIGI